MPSRKLRSWSGFWRAAWRPSSARCSELVCKAAECGALVWAHAGDVRSDTKTRTRDGLEKGSLRERFIFKFFMQVFSRKSLQDRIGYGTIGFLRRPAVI